MRFYKPGATEYQSQFSPLNLDFMQKNLAQKEANDLVAEDLIDKASQLKIKGGNYTKDEEVKKYQDWIDTNTATVRDKFYSGELDAKEAARNLGKISQFYNTNEVIKRMNNDYIYSQGQNKNLVEGKLNKAVGTNFNYLGQTPTWDKVNMSEITDDQHAALYNTIAPTSMYDKENYLEQFKDMKAKVSGTSFAGNASLDFSTGVPLIMNTDRKTVNSQLTRAMVREIAAQMAPQEINNAATPWVQYNQNKYKGNYNEANFIDDFENAFTGYVDTYTSDVNKRFSQVSGSSSDKTTKTEGRNPRRPANQPEKEVGFEFDNLYFATPTANMPTDPMSPSYSGKVEKTTKAPKQIYELPTQMKNVVLDFAKNNSKWKKIYDKPEGKYSDLDTFYKELKASGILELHKKQQIKSQTTMGYINSDSADWAKLFGGTKGSRTLAGLTNTPLDTDWYNLETGKKFTLKQLTDQAANGDKTVINGIGEYEAENNINTFLPRKLDGTRPFSLNIDGKEYVAQSPYTTQTEDRHIQEIYKTIFETNTSNLKKGTPLNFSIPTNEGTYDINGFRFKYDRKNEVFNLLTDEGAPITTLDDKGQEMKLNFPNATELYNYLLTNFTNPTNVTD
jgi:hypothetical protein